MRIRLDGKRALVTGAGRGIGRGIAEALAQAGANVGLMALEAAELEDVSSAIGGAPWRAVDLSDSAALNAAWESLTAEMGGLPEVVVHAAGYFDFAPTPEYDRARWDRLVATHLDAGFEFARLALPSMAEAGWGRLIFVSSISGRTGEIYAAAYSAAKAGLVGLTQSLAKEFAGRGVTINSICPGWVDTYLTNKQLTDPAYWELVGKTGEQVMHDAIHKDMPIQRFIRPDEIGALAAFLASPLADSITGQPITIDGGMAIHG